MSIVFVQGVFRGLFAQVLGGGVEGACPYVGWLRLVGSLKLSVSFGRILSLL